MTELRGILTVIAIGLGCALVLAATHRLTADAIGRNETAADRAVLASVLGASPEATRALPDLSGPGLWDWCGRMLIARTDVAGYGGPIRILLTMTPAPAGNVEANGAGEEVRARRLIRLALLGHQETPGITDFLKDPEWLATFSGLTADGLADVDAVGGATITTRAIARGLAAVVADPAATTTHAPERLDCMP